RGTARGAFRHQGKAAKRTAAGSGFTFRETACAQSATGGENPAGERQSGELSIFPGERPRVFKKNIADSKRAWTPVSRIIGSGRTLGWNARRQSFGGRGAGFADRNGGARWVGPTLALDACT